MTQASGTVPTQYAVRHPRPDDLRAAYEIVRDVEIADAGTSDFTEEDMQVVWKTTPHENIWLVEDESGKLVAYAAVHPRHPTRLRLWTGVLPDHRGKGIGTHLLQLAEELAHELAKKAPQGEEVMIGQDVGPLNTDAAPFLEAHGYEQERTFWKMGIELDSEPPEPEISEGITIEPMRPGTEREIFDTAEEAFQDHWDHVPHDYDEWRAWMVERESFDPTLWLIAYEGDEIAGSSLNFIDPDEAWVAVLSVRRPWRKRGLGLALLHASFREFHRRGVEKAALGVDAQNPTGATRLYERAGMHVVREEKLYRKPIERA